MTGRGPKSAVVPEGGLWSRYSSLPNSPSFVTLPSPLAAMRTYCSLALLLLSTAAGPAFASEAIPASLASTVEPIVKERAFRTFRSSMRVVRVDDGEVVFSEHSDRALVPASTMKTVTAATALRHLGPSYRFKTSILHILTYFSDTLIRYQIIGNRDDCFWFPLHDAKLTEMILFYCSTNHPYSGFFNNISYPFK